MTFKNTHISLIRTGDTIEHKGRVMTVSASDIKRGGFMGDSIFGDCYRCGSLPVKRVVSFAPQPA